MRKSYSLMRVSRIYTYSFLLHRSHKKIRKKANMYRLNTILSPSKANPKLGTSSSKNKNKKSPKNKTHSCISILIANWPQGIQKMFGGFCTIASDGDQDLNTSFLEKPQFLTQSPGCKHLTRPASWPSPTPCPLRALERRKITWWTLAA